ncbi:MAG: hypothetical protein GY800_13090 [Planctomycetes bacterium]|nr:hypothetical protein [Planctomycetota bacterium]
MAALEIDVEVPLVPRRDDPLTQDGSPTQRYMEFLEQLTDAVQALATNQIALNERVTALEP